MTEKTAVPEKEPVPPYELFVSLLQSPESAMTLADLEEAQRLAEQFNPPAAYELALRHFRRVHPGAPAHEAEQFAAGVRWLAEERIRGRHPVSAWVLGVLILAEGRTP